MTRRLWEQRFGRDAARMRTLLIGAGNAGESLLRDILRLPESRWSVVGFLDDDPAKSGKVIHGLKVFAGNGDLTLVCKQHKVDEVLISSSRMSEGTAGVAAPWVTNWPSMNSAVPLVP